MYLFESFIGRVEWIRRYKTGPLLEERDAFPRHLQDEGHSVRRLREYNWYLLPIAELMDLCQSAQVTNEQVARAATVWRKQHCRRSSTVQTHRHQEREFRWLAIKWLRFLGKWEDSTAYSSFQVPMDSFLRHLSEELGHTVQTIHTRKSALRPFFTWLAAQSCSLSEVRPEIVAAYFVQNKCKEWKRATVAAYAESLRMFFRFAEEQGWCEAGIASTIQRPRIYSLSGLPQGPTWKTVQQIIASVEGNRPGCIRDRAIILLLAVYGLRIGEVVNLTLDDIDWQHDRIWIKRLKRRLPQEYPLIPEAGEAILRYLREVRPRCAFRNVAGIVRLAGKGRKVRFCPLWKQTMDEMDPLVRGRTDTSCVFLNHCGNALTRFGLHALVERYAKRAAIKIPTLVDKRVSPHTIRHTTATHLLRAGVDINTIRAWLGHVSVETTNIYVETDLAMKAKALSACDPGIEKNSSKGKWKNNKEVMDFLNGLK